MSDVIKLLSVPKSGLISAAELVKSPDIPTTCGPVVTHTICIGKAYALMPGPCRTHTQSDYMYRYYICLQSIKRLRKSPGQDQNRLLDMLDMMEELQVWKYCFSNMENESRTLAAISATTSRNF